METQPDRVENCRRGGSRRPAGRQPAHPGPPREGNGRKARRRAYKAVQAMYWLDRARATELCLSRNWEKEDKEMSDGLYEYWRNLFETEAASDTRPVIPIRDVQWELIQPIGIEEVEKCLENGNESTPGPDGLTLRQLKAQPVQNLAVMLNTWLMAEHLPVWLRRGSTTLVEKKKNARKPITLGTTGDYTTG